MELIAVNVVLVARLWVANVSMDKVEIILE